MSFRGSDTRTLLEASLLDAANLFGADTLARKPALDQHLATALAEFNRVAPRLVSTTLTLVAKLGNYAAPADAIRFHSSEVVDDQNELSPWNEYRIPQVPVPIITHVGGVRAWQFRPTPSEFMIQRIGREYPYTYYARHVLDETTAANTTLTLEQQPLLIMRAQVESLRAIALRNAHKPVAMRDATYSQTKNGTPAALAEQTMRMWEQMVRPSTELYGTLRLAGG